MNPYNKGKPVKSQGRKAIGSKVLKQHYDSLVAKVTMYPKPALLYAAGLFFEKEVTLKNFIYFPIWLL